MYTFCKKAASIISGTIGLLLFLSLIWVFVYKYFNPPVTVLMIMRQVESRLQTNILGREWKSIEQISPEVLCAVIASEDQKFFDHFGFDFDEIDRVIDKKGKSKRIRGASTISQQTAKNVFLWPERSWVRKGIEAYFTLLIELLWGKERILEVYMNVIETGRGTFGIEAASKKYFKKTCSKLTRSEAALIAAALPNPLKRNPARPSSYMTKRKRWIMSQMNNLGGRAFIKRNLPQVNFRP